VSQIGTRQLESSPFDQQKIETKSIETRFGVVEYAAENLLYFPDGLLAFNDLHEFIVMPNPNNGPLFWIQSTEDSDIAFLLTDPTNFFPDYAIAPDNTERKKLGMRKEDTAYVLTLVTVDADQNITLNLQAPILFTAHSNRAIQVILDQSTYSTREPTTEPK